MIIIFIVKMPVVSSAWLTDWLHEAQPFWEVNISSVSQISCIL